MTILDPDLLAFITRARNEAPDVRINPAMFAVHLASFGHAAADLDELHAGALWITCGCIQGDHDAMSAFEARYANEIASTLAHAFDSGTAQDAELAMRERLFLVDGERRPKLASYSGRGDLRAWLRAGSLRTAIDLIRARRTFPVDPSTLVDAGDFIDPVGDALESEYQAAFRAAFGDASRALSDADRALLEAPFVDHLSIDELAPRYRVHRATIARRLVAIRGALFEATRAGLMERLGLTECEADGALSTRRRLNRSCYHARVTAIAQVSLRRPSGTPC